ncbi:MAG: hypothetical protein JO368_04010, partial [Acidimicrobiales bacterium]|nr:hypothetical protein [Acidimicrobiales bacterium]
MASAIGVVALLAVGVSAAAANGSAGSTRAPATAPVVGTTPSPALAPRRLVVLGDSTAESLGAALQNTAPAGTQVIDGGLFGCGVATSTWASMHPPIRQLKLSGACSESTPTGGQWPAVDARTVAVTGPGDVVLFIAGSWECEDLLHGGRWSNI